MLKELISLANNLNAKGLRAEADALGKVIKASLEDAPSYWYDKDLPSIEKHKETPFYYIKANRAIGEGDGAVFFGLQDSVYHTLKSLGGLSKESESPQGPFTAEDVRVIASIISDYLKKDFKSVVFPELGEDVKKMIGKEFMSLTQEDWPLASTIIGFEIIKYNPILSLFGKAGEGERVGEISIDGQITLADPESFGESFTEYLPGRYPASFYGSLRGLDPEVDREKIEQSEELWRRKTEEAKRRAIEKDFPPEEFREEGPVSDLEIPMGKEIELIENPEHYNFSGDSSMINRYKKDLEYGRSFRTQREFPYEDSKERELMENYIDIYSSVNLTKDLVKLANNLDAKGLRGEADALDRVIKKLAQSEELDSGLSGGAGVTIDSGFLAQFAFEDARPSDKEQISHQVSLMRDGHRIKENDIVFNYNNGNFSIVIPSNDPLKSLSGSEVYVSYADTRADKASMAMTELLLNKLKEMGAKQEEIPAPMSGTNLEANTETWKEMGSKAVEAPRVFPTFSDNKK